MIDVSLEHEGVTILTLNRPEKRNALNRKMAEELIQRLKEVETRVMILRAEGPAFCAGMDLKENVSEQIAELLTTLYQAPYVTIAAVQGFALAGGAGLVLACDLAVATQEATFGFPEVRRGLVAAQVMTLLMRQLNMREIRELVLLAEQVSAVRALEMGLINRIANDLLQETLNLSKSILEGGEEAIKETKKLIEDLYPTNFSDDFKKAIVYHDRARQSKEAKKRIDTFFQS